MEQAMREEFEAWLLREHGLESEWQEERNCFKDYPAHLAFKAWQASRAALRVELPFPIIVDEGAEFALHAYDKDETDKALQQAGIEVK
ncbi:hypothetical protein [Pseudomonas aeruginosa]|uniref:hypothetical protein n=1 Tax=Pseudomonas aeruginosa TaxID=287 RepID=UPI00191422C1|nr:hypothetical protein [Pseudomonas aeruginosa]